MLLWQEPRQQRWQPFKKLTPMCRTTAPDLPRLSGGPHADLGIRPGHLFHPQRVSPLGHPPIHQIRRWGIHLPRLFRKPLHCHRRGKCPRRLQGRCRWPVGGGMPIYRRHRDHGVAAIGRPGDPLTAAAVGSRDAGGLALTVEVVLTCARIRTWLSGRWTHHPHH